MRPSRNAAGEKGPGEKGDKRAYSQAAAVAVTSWDAACRTDCSERGGASSSTSRKPRPSWRQLAVAWLAASPTEASSGSAERQNNWDRNQRCQDHAGRERGSRANDPPKKLACPSFPARCCWDRLPRGNYVGLAWGICPNRTTRRSWPCGPTAGYSEPPSRCLSPAVTTPVTCSKCDGSEWNVKASIAQPLRRLSTARSTRPRRRTLRHRRPRTRRPDGTRRRCWPHSGFSVDNSVYLLLRDIASP